MQNPLFKAKHIVGDVEVTTSMLYRDDTKHYEILQEWQQEEGQQFESVFVTSALLLDICKALDIHTPGPTA